MKTTNIVEAVKTAQDAAWRCAGSAHQRYRNGVEHYERSAWVCVRGALPNLPEWAMPEVVAAYQSEYQRAWNWMQAR